MARKSAVELSDHREEIDDLLLQGKSARFVSNYLIKKYSEKISHKSINNYKKKHLNISKEASLKYQEEISKNKKDNVVDKIIDNLHLLDEIIVECSDTNIDLSEIDDPVKKADLQIKKKRLGLDAIKIKENIIKDNSVDVNINNNEFESYFNDDLLREIIHEKEERFD